MRSHMISLLLVCQSGLALCEPAMAQSKSEHNIWPGRDIYCYDPMPRQCVSDFKTKYPPNATNNGLNSWRTTGNAGAGGGANGGR